MNTLLLPLQIGPDGRTMLATPAQSLRNMIEQVLFTAPGERVNRPTFGSGLQQFVFAPASDEMATALEFTIQAALLEWLGERIQVEQVAVASADSMLSVTVVYTVLVSQERQTDTFLRSLAD
ncbi:GPW/gp25 family protein [Ferrovibrio xuzhouensis]|uniref:GPW/gp25 family protein n=1 Tax=Ferrovibrio xuzhouensis TaxID=1576914 RepID=A0ABV7VLJ1_9PROT